MLVRCRVFCGHSFLLGGWGRLVAAVLLGVFAAVDACADSVVARIDQATLTADEFRLFLGWHKALVARRLFPNAPVVTSAMWNQSIGDVLPSNVWREAALRDALRAKTRQMVYAEHGLTHSTAFAAIEADLADENGRRSRASASGAVVFGPRQWSLESYYRNRDAELLTRLRDQLRTDEAPSRAHTASPEALDRRVDALVHDRFAHAKVTVDHDALMSVPLP